jgi:hypothetical protein
VVTCAILPHREPILAVIQFAAAESGITGAATVNDLYRVMTLHL